MQPRLMRSNTEKIIAGVCGGLGEYFALDPVIVRLIFVVVTMTSGMGPPAYIILWVIMPRAQKTPHTAYHPGFPAQSHPSAHAAPHISQQAGQPVSQQGEPAAVPAGQRAAQAGAHGRYGVYAPQPQQQFPQQSAQPGVFPHGQPHPDQPMGQPWQPGMPATGQTVKLAQPTAQATGEHAPTAQIPPRRGRNWHTLGFILLSIGGLILLQELTGSSFVAFVFPLLMIGAGVLLLRRGYRP